MTTFLHVFLLSLGTTLASVGAVAVWIAGLLVPTEALMDRDHLTLALGYFFGYIALTAAIVAGIVAAAA